MIYKEFNSYELQHEKDRLKSYTYNDHSLTLNNRITLKYDVFGNWAVNEDIKDAKTKRQVKAPMNLKHLWGVNIVHDY